jgi:hypothetical protein
MTKKNDDYTVMAVNHRLSMKNIRGIEKYAKLEERGNRSRWLDKQLDKLFERLEEQSL